MTYNRREFIRKSCILTGAAGLPIPIPSGSDENYFTNQADVNRLVLLGVQGGPFIRSYQQTPSASLIVYKICLLLLIQAME